MVRYHSTSMLVVSLEGDKLSVQVGTVADRGCLSPSVLAPVLGGALALAGLAHARSRKRTDEALLVGGAASVASAGIAHFGSFTCEWTFDKQRDAVTCRSAPFWQPFSAVLPKQVCRCSQLSPQGVQDGDTVDIFSKFVSGVAFRTITTRKTAMRDLERESGARSLEPGRESAAIKQQHTVSDPVSTRYTPGTATIGKLSLMLFGKEVPVCSNVRAGQAYMLADFLAFDFNKISATRLSEEEAALGRAVFNTLDTNGDGVLEVHELRALESVIPKDLAVLGAASPLIHIDQGSWTRYYQDPNQLNSNLQKNKNQDICVTKWVTRDNRLAGSLCDHFEFLDVNRDGQLQQEEFERWLKIRKAYPPKGSPPQALADRLRAWCAALPGVLRSLSQHTS